MERHVLIQLRVAVVSDFANEDNSKKIGAPYFEQASSRVIQPVVKYFTNETDIDQFKNLFNAGQIYVMKTPNEVKSVFNCIDWDLVETELETETQLLNQIVKKYQKKRVA
jgi:hypothetical protein